MTPVTWIFIVGVVACFAILVLTVTYQREIRRHGEAMFEKGWLEGWDDREHDHHPDSPEPRGRHHLTALEAETAITEFLIASGVEAEPLPPLPKRVKKACP